MADMRLRSGMAFAGCVAVVAACGQPSAPRSARTEETSANVAAVAPPSSASAATAVADPSAPKPAEPAEAKALPTPPELAEPEAQEVEPVGEELRCPLPHGVSTRARLTILVLDRSGSMSGAPLVKAREACSAAAKLFKASDWFGVIAFDTMPAFVVELQPVADRKNIEKEIATISAGGGTDIFPALDLAYTTIAACENQRKTVVLVTDGRAPESGLRDIATAMSVSGFALSTVGLGPDVDEPMLRMLAEVGGGTMYHVAKPDELSKAVLEALKAP